MNSRTPRFVGPHTLCSPGFTMVEMLAVLALTAVLSGAILTVSLALHRSAQAMRQSSPGTQNEPGRMLYELFRKDLIHARALTSQDDQVRFISESSLDPVTRRRRTEPAEIRYHLETVDHSPNHRTSWLVRDQTAIDRPDHRDAERFREFVLPNVASFTLTVDEGRRWARINLNIQPHNDSANPRQTHPSSDTRSLLIILD